MTMDTLETLPFRPRWHYVLAAILLSGIVAAYYLPQVLLGKSLGEGEGVTYYLPMRELAADAWQNGRWPLWNPYTYGGMPLLADCQAAVFYPLNLLYLLLEPVVAMNVIMLTGHIIAVWGMIFLLRAYRVSAWPSAAGAIAFVFSGFLIAHMGHVTIVNAAVWLPWLCLVTHYWCVQGRRRWLIAGVLLWAMQFLAGHPQIVVYSAIIVAMQIVTLWIRGFGRSWRCIGGLVLMGVLAGTLCGVQIWPTLDLSADTGRCFTPSLELFQRYHLPLKYTPLLWLPFLYGTQTYTLLNWAWWGDWNFVELAGYVGLLPWMLLPAAVCLPGGRLRFGRAWAIIGGLHLLLAWNTDTPLGKLLFHVPVYNSFESAGRHLLGLILALSICTGVGLEALAETTRLRRRRWSRRSIWAVGFIVLAIITGGMWGYQYAIVDLQYHLGIIQERPASALRPWIQAPWVFIMPILMLILSAWALVRYAHKTTFIRRFVVLAVLLIDVGSAGYLCAWRWRHQGAYRLSAPSAELSDLLSPTEPGTPPPRFLLFGPWGEYYGINAQGNMLYRLASLNGYGPFQLRRFNEMVGRMNHDGLVTDESLLGPSRALDLWSCRYVIVSCRSGVTMPPESLTDSPRYRLVKTVECTDKSELRVYENINMLPHARFVDDVVALPGKEAVLTAITAGQLPDGQLYDPSQTVLVSSTQDGDRLTPVQPTSETISHNRTVHWLTYDHDRLCLQTRTDSDSVLALSEPFIDGWNAYIDGDEHIPVTRVDYMLRAVCIPAGTHILEMRYEPIALDYGLSASLAGFAGILLTICWPRRPRYSNSHE